MVSRPGLRAGRTYRVTVKVRTRSGTRVLFDERLHLHRSTSRPVESD